MSLQQQKEALMKNKLLTTSGTTTSPLNTLPTTTTSSLVAADDEDLNNGIVDEAMKQRIAEQKLLKQNPFAKTPGLLDPNSPMTNGELQNPLNPLKPNNLKGLDIQPENDPASQAALLAGKSPTETALLAAKTPEQTQTQEELLLRQQHINQQLAKNPQAAKNIMTENGDMCVFPFVYNGKTFFDCTTEDDISGRKWCSIKSHNYDMHPQKGYCLDATQPADLVKQTQLQVQKQRMAAEEEQAHLEAQVATQVAALRDPLDPNSTPTEPIKTEDGRECRFPFTYKQKTYYDCINLDEPSGRYWCSTSDEQQGFDQQPIKSICVDERFPKPAAVDPVVNEEALLGGSISLANKNPLAPLDPTKAGLTDAISPLGADKAQLSLTAPLANPTNPLDPTKPATDPEKMAEQDKLREALDPYKNLKDYATPEDRLKAKINLEEKLKMDKGEPITNNPDPDKALTAPTTLPSGNPFERKTIATETGEPCVFPFVHNGKSYFDCTSDDDPTGKYWCGTTSNFDRDKRKGFCVDPRNENAGGTASVAQLKLDALRRLQNGEDPAVARNHNNNNNKQYGIGGIGSQFLLSRKDYLHLAGEELVSSDSGLKIYGGNSKKHSRCAIPFIYNRKSYFSCVPFTTPQKQGESWCSTSHNFDKDMKWGVCCTKEKCGADWDD